MTVKELVRKVVCDETMNKLVMIDGRDVVLTESNINLKVKDFRIVARDDRVKIHIETK